MTAMIGIICFLAGYFVKMFVDYLDKNEYVSTTKTAPNGHPIKTCQYY